MGRFLKMAAWQIRMTTRKLKKLLIRLKSFKLLQSLISNFAVNQFLDLRYKMGSKGVFELFNKSIYQSAQHLRVT